MGVAPLEALSGGSGLMASGSARPRPPRSRGKSRAARGDTAAARQLPGAGIQRGGTRCGQKAEIPKCGGRGRPRVALVSSAGARGLLAWPCNKRRAPGDFSLGRATSGGRPWTSRLAVQQTAGTRGLFAWPRNKGRAPAIAHGWWCDKWRASVDFSLGRPTNGGHPWTSRLAVQQTAGARGLLVWPSNKRRAPGDFSLGRPTSGGRPGTSRWAVQQAAGARGRPRTGNFAIEAVCDPPRPSQAETAPVEENARCSAGTA